MHSSFEFWLFTFVIRKDNIKSTLLVNFCAQWSIISYNHSVVQQSSWTYSSCKLKLYTHWTATLYFLLPTQCFHSPFLGVWLRDASYKWNPKVSVLWGCLISLIKMFGFIHFVTHGRWILSFYPKTVNDSRPAPKCCAYCKHMHKALHQQQINS